MSTSYEPLPVDPPDLELMLSAHLRSIGPANVLYGRRFPASLPLTSGGTTYGTAVIVRDDGGSWPSRLVSVTVLGAKDADYATVRQFAAAIAGRLSTLALAEGLPVAAVTAVRGPLSVADNPPEFQLTADLVVVG